MAHLTGARTERKINSIEVVSDDSLRVLKFSIFGNTVSIGMRDATESEWSTKNFATLDKDDATVIATILNGGTISDYGGVLAKIEGVVTTAHKLPEPETVKGPLDGDCTPLEIERARAENLREEAQNLKEERAILALALERDHALDKHITAEVKGCPACDRKVSPGHGDGSLPDDDSLPF